MDWAQVLTLFLGMFSIFFGNIGVIWWFRKESRDDMKEFRKESREDWKLIHQEMKEFKDAVRFEMKDFHERLLKIEMERGR